MERVSLCDESRAHTLVSTPAVSQSAGVVTSHSPQSWLWADGVVPLSQPANDRAVNRAKIAKIKSNFFFMLFLLKIQCFFVPNKHYLIV
ncbi:MAG: hypothetical protein LBH20_05690 [Treponema sp.]|jgi:hypothetical protein|nr:hypothetical protein [Treponema sp.]